MTNKSIHSSPSMDRKYARVGATNLEDDAHEREGHVGEHVECTVRQQALPLATGAHIRHLTSRQRIADTTHTTCDPDAVTGNASAPVAKWESAVRYCQIKAHSLTSTSALLTHAAPSADEEMERDIWHSTHNAHSDYHDIANIARPAM